MSEHSYTNGTVLWDIRETGIKNEHKVPRLRTPVRYALRRASLGMTEVMGISAHLRFLAVLGAVVYFCGALGCQLSPLAVTGMQSDTQQPVGAAQSDSGLIIETESPLPETYPHASYEFRFRARGGVPTLHWRLEKGALPPGIKLEDDGFLHGSPDRVGEFQFTISVRDGGQPQQSVQKEMVLRVTSAMTLHWKEAAHVNGNRIEGTAEVSNTTPDDIDLTFIVLAVPGNGRAVAIGYQHFILRRGTLAKELPFGETLPRGGYVVHVDAVGEVPAKKVIYRERMQTPSMLQVNVGP